MSVSASSSLRCIVIAGPNGACKTTFAREFLPDQDIVHFVNADLIASGLSALDPRDSALTAGRVFGSCSNFTRIYRTLADEWSVYDNSGPTPRLIGSGP